MNINSLTIKAQEVLQSAMNLASGNGNQAVEPLHILSAMSPRTTAWAYFCYKNSA